MTTASVREAVKTTLENIKRRTPAYIELADKFGPLFLAAAKQRDELAEQGVDVPAIDPARIGAGVPVLVDIDFSPWAQDFANTAELLLPTLCEVLDLDQDAQNFLRDHLTVPENISGLVQARIEGDWKLFENTSVKNDTVSTDTLLYISETISAPVLCAIVQALDEPLSSLAWEHGNCPVCGSTPSISYLSPKEVTDLDQLVGGGGKKYLHCSLCGHDWRFKRNICPSCGNDENESREIFTADNAKAERVEACHKCGKYCLNVDMREYEPRPDLDAVQIGLIHLDLFAHENELQPITSTLWNAID